MATTIEKAVYKDVSVSIIKDKESGLTTSKVFTISGKDYESAVDKIRVMCLNNDLTYFRPKSHSDKPVVWCSIKNFASYAKLKEYISNKFAKTVLDIKVKNGFVLVVTETKNYVYQLMPNITK